MPKCRIKHAAALFLFAAQALVAGAQDYPARPLQIVVGFSPGGGTDVLARVIAVPLSKILGQPVVVRNAPGAGGQLAASAVLREGADGHALLALNQPDLNMTVGTNNAPYKTTDFQVIMVDVRDPRIMLVPSNSDFNSFADFVTRAKAQPGKLGVSVAQGSAQEQFAKWLFPRLGLDVLVVGYKGGADAANAMLTGDVAANIGDDYARLTYRQRSKALFIASKDKSPRWPEAPLFTTVLAPYNVTPPSPDFLARFGIYAVPSAFKKKFPASYARLQQALLQARDSAEFKDYIAKNSLQDQSIGKPGEAFDAIFSADMVELEKIK